MESRDLFKADFEPYLYCKDRLQDCGRYRIEYGHLVTPRGDSPYTICRMWEFVCVLAVVPGNYGEQPRIALALQYRYAINRWQLEMPAGRIEAGETPLEAAARELREECGLVPDELVDLGLVYPTAGSADEVARLVAVRCAPGRVSTDFDMGEQVQTVLATREEFERVLADGSMGQSVAYATWMRADAQGLLDAWL
jgi:ADP-ribose pyrophosphatase